jgi:hypothetical protein
VFSANRRIAAVPDPVSREGAPACSSTLTNFIPDTLIKGVCRRTNFRLLAI